MRYLTAWVCPSCPLGPPLSKWQKNFHEGVTGHKMKTVKIALGLKP